MNICFKDLAVDTEQECFVVFVQGPATVAGDDGVDFGSGVSRNRW
ncbi:MAG: hypothetical protein ACJASX_001788 [Limisphaerales bacterium]